ncbi:MAG: hypothetical protein GY801_46515 [bacterium]|nr:hypothetical protein [bacterium]
MELVRQRPQAFDSARPIKQWRTCWPSSLEALLERFCQSQGHSHGIKDVIHVLLLYRDSPAGEVEAAVELALDYQLSASDGVNHLLLHSGPEPSVESLSQWASLPPTDISKYGQLQATAAPTCETGGGCYEGSDCDGAEAESEGIEAVDNVLLFSRTPPAGKRDSSEL